MKPVQVKLPRCRKVWKPVQVRVRRHRKTRGTYFFETEIGQSASTVVSKAYYDLAFDNNYETGTGTATITFKGNYTGTKTLTFKISVIP